jgi:hypothetical protein
MFPHRKLHKYTWTSSDGKTNRLIMSLSTQDDNEVSLMSDPLEGLTVRMTTVWQLQNLRETLSLSKLATRYFDMQRFDLRKLNDAEIKEQCQVKFSNRFAALENKLG